MTRLAAIPAMLVCGMAAAAENSFYKTIGGSDYLFIEAGGFGERRTEGWKPPLYVLKQANGPSN